jgi:hypothetical protein
VAETLQREAGITLLTIPRKHQAEQLPPDQVRRHNHFRHIIETVASQLAEQLQIERNHAKTFWGLCTRLVSKRTAHTLCTYLNWRLGASDWLQIKQLAFPHH